jgi:hypothetical protein
MLVSGDWETFRGEQSRRVLTRRCSTSLILTFPLKRWHAPQHYQNIAIETTV